MAPDTPASRKKRNLTEHFKLAVVVLLIALFILIWYRSRQQEQEQIRSIKPPVTIIKPEQGKLNRVFQISGYIEAESMVTVLPRISGVLTTLTVDMGDRVSKGDLLAEIDASPYKLQLEQARAAFLAAQSTFNRITQLYASNAASRQSYEEVKAQYEAMKAQYELAELQHSYTRVESPIDGVVLVKHSTAGSLVAPQVPIVTIGNTASLIIKAQVPEHYYHFFLRKQETMPVSVTIPALENQSFSATVTRIAPYISPETKNFEVLCALSGDTSMVRPGMFLFLTFTLDERPNTYYLPFDALVSGNSIWYVDIESDQAHKKDFTPSYYNAKYFEIPRDWSGTWFILEGQHFLREGQEVRILNKDAAIK